MFALLKIGYIMDILKTKNLLLDSQKDTMNNQKDTQKTSLNPYGQTDIYTEKILINKGSYDFANKKTEKLITALYMVTDCMETDETLRNKLRSLGVELLSDVYKINYLSITEKYSHIQKSLSRVSEIVSFIEIAQTIGFISEMNGLILKKEFSILAGEMKSYESKDKHFSFALDDKMFEVKNNILEDGLGLSENNNNTKENNIKDKSESFIKKKKTIKTNKKKSNVSYSDIAVNREDRVNKIISFIKDRKKTYPREDGVPIKDIALAFVDVSEKTIQRDLNSLAEKGKIKKIGQKRWSRYQIV